MTTLRTVVADSLIVARRELARTFRGRRGVFLVVALLAVAALPALARAMGNAGDQAAQLQQAQIAALMRIFSREVVRSLIDCPPPLTVGIVIMLFFQPAYVLLIGLDLVAGDIESGAMRFWTGRASRTGVLLGKALGLWATVSALTLIVFVVIGATSAIGAVGDRAGVLRWGPKLYLVSCVSALAQVSLVVLIGASASHPRRVLGAGLLLLMSVRVVRGVLTNHGVALASWLPGAQDDRLLSPALAAQMGGLTLVFAWSVLFLTAAAAVFHRRSL